MTDTLFSVGAADVAITSDNGLPETELHRLVRVTMESSWRRHYWRFFCGCCWNLITDMQEDARRIVESQDAGTDAP